MTGLERFLYKTPLMHKKNKNKQEVIPVMVEKLMHKWVLELQLITILTTY